MKAFLAGLMFTIPGLAIAQSGKFEDRIITMKNGQPVVVLVKTTPLKREEAPPLCEKEIVVRIEHGQKLTTPNPFYETCIDSRNQFEQSKVKAQERGGEEDL